MRSSIDSSAVGSWRSLITTDASECSRVFEFVKPTRSWCGPLKCSAKAWVFGFVSAVEAWLTAGVPLRGYGSGRH